jgi:ubiquinone/menaquinone biosynthesis C-methylase UbiE
VDEFAGDALENAGRILDIGCGTGWWLERLSRNPRIGAELHGIDLLPDRIDAARARVPTARLVVGDATALPYPDGHFDAVFMFTTLSSMASHAAIAAALREGRRAVAPGGVLLVWEPRLPNVFNRSTLHVSRRLLRSALGPALAFRSTTVVPALARHLGPRTPALYPVLARAGFLRTHRLVLVRAADHSATA